MGFYLRKSVRVGPLRFNMSKSGIGVSTGIKGFRVGSGPRGNYVHMSAGGLHYRKTFSKSKATNNSLHPDKPNSHLHNEISHEPLKEIESGDIKEMVDSSSAELVEEMNSKRKKTCLWLIALLLGIIVVSIVHHNSLPTWVMTTTGIFFALATYIAYVYDQLRKTTVLFFELDSSVEKLYQNLHDAFDKIAACSAKWHVEAEGDVKDKKRNAGASTIIKRNSISLGKGNPPYVKTNVSVPSIPVGKQTLYFFPDKILVFEKNGVGAVSYSCLEIDVEPTRFIEDGSVPKDSKIVDKTWRYVNKKGGPDKRFKDNKELPIVLYEDIHFQSTTGLNERVEISKVDLCDDFSSAIHQLARSIT